MDIPKKIIAVGYPLGRVGSSALMGLLRLAGCNVGKNIFTEPDPMNPRGFFELPTQQYFLERIYLGIYPHIALPPSPTMLTDIGRNYTHEYRALLASEFAPLYPAAIKSQWFLTLPFFEELREEFDIRLLALERNLEDQVRSFWRVWQNTDHPIRKYATLEFIREYILKWREFGQQILSTTLIPTMKVSFDQLMQQPEPLMADICRFTGLPPLSSDVLAAWLEPKLINRPKLGLEGESHPARISVVAGDQVTKEDLTQPIRISLVVNTQNAAEMLDDCLKSAVGIVDEMVVVDMQSEDATLDIARKYGARIFPHERLGYVELARNFAVNQARGEWILLLDADERLTPALREGLPKVLATPQDIDIFLIPRNNRIAGRWLLGSGWGIEYECQPRFFRKGCLEWPNKIQQRPHIRGKQGFLPLSPEAAIDHLNVRNMHQMIARINRVTDIESQDLERRHQKWSLEEMFVKMGEEFRFRYDPDRDGVHSLMLGICMAFSRFLTWAKLWEKHGFPQVSLPPTAEALLTWLVNPDKKNDDWRLINEVIYAHGMRQADPAVVAKTLESFVTKVSESILKGETGPALAMLNQALALSPNDPDLTVTRANLLFQMGDVRQAQNELYRVCLFAPNFWPAHVYLAALLFDAGHLSEAEPVARKALEVNPGNLEALRILGRILLKLNRFDETIPVEQERLSRLPNDVNTYLTLGLCYFKTGNPEASRQMYCQALQLDPGNERARSSLAILDQQQLPSDITH
jgi:tetratricopeptide (TPR) repeat protein